MVKITFDLRPPPQKKIFLLITAPLFKLQKWSGYQTVDMDMANYILRFQGHKPLTLTTIMIFFIYLVLGLDDFENFN